jgi:hypothetical protein
VTNPSRRRPRGLDCNQNGEHRGDRLAEPIVEVEARVAHLVVAAFEEGLDSEVESDAQPSASSEETTSAIHSAEEGSQAGA